MATWLGWMGLLGAVVAPAARAESEPCDCVKENQSVRSETPCLLIFTYTGCATSSVRNTCAFPVTLEDWPLTDCQDSRCSRLLEPRQEAAFYFGTPRDWSPRGKVEREERFDEETFSVRVDGRLQSVTVTAEVTCLERTASKSGCSSTAGGLAWPAVLALLGLRARRRADARTWVR
ncbi:hypothetical protein LZ198_26685 [Myxococcus sp. K15C18031901]|nr:hypothetical protein [Myxococcus dinghuensis]